MENVILTRIQSNQSFQPLQPGPGQVVGSRSLALQAPDKGIVPFLLQNILNPFPQELDYSLSLRFLNTISVMLVVVGDELENG